MAVAILDILWRVCAWGVVAAGVGVVGHAMLTDWVRGLLAARRVGCGEGSADSLPGTGGAVGRARGKRVRCPGGWGRLLGFVPYRQGCWYDMGAAMQGEDGLFQCPECGRRCSASRLGRSRRRYGLAGVGLLVIVAGLGGRYSRELHRRGWAAVPDEALVLVPFDERLWLETGTTGAHWLIEGAAKEIQARDNADRLSRRSAAWLGERVRTRYERDADYGADGASVNILGRLESTPFVEGIPALPLGEAAARIAAAAGLEIEVDLQALVNVSINPDQRVTVPAFGGMTCEQALEWACDRARAGQGWAHAEWGIEGGRVLVSNDTSLHATRRVLVRRAPEVGGCDAERLRSVTTGLVAFDRWRENGGSGGEAWNFGDAMVVSASPGDIVRVDRFLQRLEEARGMEEEEQNRAAVVAVAERLASAPITAIESEDTLEIVVHRIRSEAGVPIVLDAWGLDLYRSRLGALLERGVVRIDRTAPTADPFGRDEPDSGGVALGEVATPRGALAEFGVAYAHDGTGVVVGLRAASLLREVRVYAVPPRPAAGMGGETGTTRPVEAWDRRMEALAGRITSSVRMPDWAENGGADGRIEWLDDRLIIAAPTDMQALAAVIIERCIEEWEAEGAAPRR